MQATVSIDISTIETILIVMCCPGYSETKLTTVFWTLSTLSHSHACELPHTLIYTQHDIHVCMCLYVCVCGVSMLSQLQLIANNNIISGIQCIRFRASVSGKL